MPEQRPHGLAHTAAWLVGARPGAPKSHAERVAVLGRVADLLREHAPHDEGACLVAGAFETFAAGGGDLHELLDVKVGRGKSPTAAWRTAKRADMQQRIRAIGAELQGTPSAKAAHVVRLFREGDPRLQAVLADHPEAPQGKRALVDLFSVVRGD